MFKITLVLLAFLGCGLGRFHKDLNIKCTRNNKIYREVEYRKQQWYMYGSTDICKTCVQYTSFNENNTLHIDVVYWDPLIVQRTSIKQIGNTSKYIRDNGKCNIVYMDSDFCVEYTRHFGHIHKKTLSVFVRNIYVGENIKNRINDYLRKVCKLDKINLCPIDQCKGPRKPLTCRRYVST